MRQRRFTSGRNPRRSVRRPGSLTTKRQNHQGEPNVEIAPMNRILVSTGPIGLPFSGMAKAACGTQTRSSQPFSMAGGPYHQVG